MTLRRRLPRGTKFSQRQQRRPVRDAETKGAEAGLKQEAEGRRTPELGSVCPGPGQRHPSILKWVVRHSLFKIHSFGGENGLKRQKACRQENESEVCNYRREWAGRLCQDHVSGVGRQRTGLSEYATFLLRFQ